MISGLWERLEVEFANKRHWPRGTPGGKGGKFAPGDAQLPGDSVLADPIDVRRLTTYPSRVQEASRFLGRTVDVPSLAFLAGAIPGSVTGFTPGRAFGGSPQWSAWSHGDDPDLADWHTQVYFSKDKEENKILYLNLMEVNKSAQAQGIGLRVLCAMVDEAVRQGIPHIELWAAGHGDGTLDKHRWAGYYTWARLGFDNQIRTHYQGKEVHTIHELLAMPGGREHWYRHGHNYGGIFDLRENSYSRAVLRSYAQSKGLTVDFANTRRWPKGTPGGKGGKFMPKDAQVVQEPMVPREAAEKPIDVKALGEGELAYAKDLLGHPVDPVTLARLAGALPGCGVLAYPRGALEVRCYSLPGEPSWETSVQVQGWPARLHVNLVQVSSDAQAQGIGTRILTTLIGEAVHQGIHHVSLEAVGRGNGTLDRHREAGYYTWARLGFDGPVAFSEGPFQHVSSLHELLDLPGGREYWYRYGVKYQGIFDLREGSRSRAILRSYAQSKGLTVHFANKRHWPKGTPGGKGGKFMPRDAVLPGEEAVQPVVPVPSPPVQPIRTDRIPDEAVEHASDILGHPVDRSVIARLAGAIPGSEVISHQLGDALVMTCASLIDARDAFPAWETGVTLNPGSPSQIHIGLVRVSPDARGQGQGTQILSTLISEAVKQGIHHVTLTADGRGDGTLDKQRISGYYTWARLGFDGPVAFSEGPFQHVSSLHELLDLPGGREYWYRHGAKYQGIFDLREGSRSRAILRAYAQAKGLTVDFSQPFDPTGWKPWILTRGRRKGTPVYKKEREYRDFLPTHAPERQALDQKLFQGIQQANVHPRLKSLYLATMHDVINRMPPASVRLLNRHLTGGFRFFGDCLSAAQASAEDWRSHHLSLEGITDDERREVEEYYQGSLQLAPRQVGAFVTGLQAIYLDGFMKSWMNEIRGWGPPVIEKTLAGTYAHELTHAMEDLKLSATERWGDCWYAELFPPVKGWREKILGPQDADKRTYPLSAYASLGGRTEGFAEFGRLLYAGDVNLDQVEKRFPQCSAFFRDHGFWPGSSSQVSKPPLQVAEPPPQVSEVPPYDTRGISSSTLKNAEIILGHSVTRDQLARLTGAQPGAVVYTARGFENHPSAVVLALEGSVPASYSGVRMLLSRKLDGKPPGILNASFNVKDPKAWGSGLATKMLTTQVSEAVKHGIDGITTEAIGKGNGTRDKHDEAGYYTWARLGYDAKITRSMSRKLHGSFRSATTLHELMALPGGADDWYRYGSNFYGTFDLREGSRSRAILREYAKVKGIQVDFSEVQDFPELFQFLSEVTEKTSRGLLVDYGLPPGKEEEDPVSADFSRPFDPAGWEPYILRRGRRKGTPVYKKGREYRDFLPTHAPERQELDRRLFDGIAFSNLSHDQRILYTTTMTSILDRLPPVALSRVHQHVQTFRFYPDLVSVGTDMSQRDRQWVLTEPRFTKEDRDGHLLEYLKNMEQARQGHLGGGMFYPYKEMFLDGPPLGRSSYMDIRSWGSTPITTSLSHLYAHELTHAIDGDKQLQNDPTWYNAWVKDLVKKPAATTYPLSAYASDGGVHEGLAEFGRLVYSGQFDLGKVEQRYPNCTAFFKSQRLWPTS